MNEFIFGFHILFIIGLTFFWLKVGKEGLIFWTALQALLANLFVTKQTILFGLEVTCTDVYIIGSFLSLNLIQEYFGKEEAKKSLYITFSSLIYFIFLSGIHRLYHPSPNDQVNPAFEVILSTTPRIMLASLAVFYIVQLWDIRFFGWLKKRFTSLSLAKRNFLAQAISQLFDTILFTFLALFGTVNSLTDVMMMSYFIKLILIASSSLFLNFARYIRPYDTLPV